MTTEQKLLSIVVPIYNGEKTLPELMETFLTVRNDALEILLVNDGSTDGSLALCNSYAEKDARVKVIDKQNGGVSSARNAGIDAAKGKYLTFFDCDDLIVTETLEQAICRLPDCSEDILLFDFLFQNLKLGAERKSRFVLPDDHALQKDEIVEKILSPLLEKAGSDFESACNKFFSASCLAEHGVRFREALHSGEDWRFNADFLDVSAGARYFPKTLYIYRMAGHKHKILPGREMLSSYHCKFNLAEKYRLPVAQKEKIRLDRGILQAVAYSSDKCEKEEFSALLQDPLVKSAAREILSLDKKARAEHKVGRRERSYAILTLCKHRRLLKHFAKRLTK